jgi:hypothetical protein
MEVNMQAYFRWMSRKIAVKEIIVIIRCGWITHKGDVFPDYYYNQPLHSVEQARRS